MATLEMMGGVAQMEHLLQETAAHMRATRPWRTSAEQLEPDLDGLIQAGTLVLMRGGAIRRPVAPRLPAASMVHRGLTFYSMDFTGVRTGANYAGR